MAARGRSCGPPPWAATGVNTKQWHVRTHAKSLAAPLKQKPEPANIYPSIINLVVDVESCVAGPPKAVDFAKLKTTGGLSDEVIVGWGLGESGVRWFSCQNVSRVTGWYAQYQVERST